MRFSLIAAVVLAAAAGAAETPMKKTPPPSAAAVASVVRFAPPAGWDRSDYANAGGADAVVSFESGLDRISVYLYGAKGSFYRSPADFMRGPAATTMGRAPVRTAVALVAGRRLSVYRRGYPLAEGDPHIPSSGRERMGTETYCVLPPAPDGRFVVLSWARDTPAPDPRSLGEKAWKAFLKTVARPPVPKQ
jgi:hypothetical protein